MIKHKLLLVDAEAGARFGVRDFLQSHGFLVDEAASCQEAQERAAARPDAAVVDFHLPDGNAFELLPRLKAADPEMPVVVLTRYGSIELAVEAMKEGAENFLTKPAKLPTLLTVLQRALEMRRHRQKQFADKSHGARKPDPFLGSSAAVRQLAEESKKVVSCDSPVLLKGETGTGKGVLTDWFHRNGPRQDEAFVDLNCAGLSREFLETELFGHEKGAFTGATNRKVGLLEVAHRGTVFLDEIGDMDLQVQPKLLKVVEEKRFRRLGDVRDKQVDVGLIAATHRDLGLLVRDGMFRSDLYFRINAIQLTLPPLRERVEDILVLARSFLPELAADLGKGEVRLAPDAEQALLEYPWPGNIRELRNVLERAISLSKTSVLHREDLRFDSPMFPEGPDNDLALTLSEVERRHIERVLRAENGHVGRAAIRLGVPRSSLYQKIKSHQIPLRSKV